MTLNRRHFVQGSAALAAAGIAPGLAAQSVIKIGYVSPQTGPLAPFGEADKWVIEQMKAAFKDGITVGGRKLPVEIVLKDSQSNPNRAGEVANDLILKDRVALMLTKAASDDERQKAMTMARAFAQRLPRALEELPRDCGCLVMLKSAVAGATPHTVDLTAHLKRKVEAP